MRSLILWLLGIPIPVIILIWLLHLRAVDSIRISEPPVGLAARAFFCAV